MCNVLEFELSLLSYQHTRPTPTSSYTPHPHSNKGRRPTPRWFVMSIFPPSVSFSFDAIIFRPRRIILCFQHHNARVNLMATFFFTTFCLMLTDLPAAKHTCIAFEQIHIKALIFSLSLIWDGGKECLQPSYGICRRLLL